MIVLRSVKKCQQLRQGQQNPHIQIKRQLGLKIIGNFEVVKYRKEKRERIIHVPETENGITKN